MNREISSILVTGSSGYIGSTLCPLLLASGYKVLGVDTLYFNASPCLNVSNSNTNRFFSKWEFMQSDIRHMEEKDFEGIDAVIHLAALSNDPMGELDPYLTMDINFNATARLAYLAKKVGVKRFIFSSSCSVYGSNDDFVSEHFDTNPLTTYARTKLLAEREIRKLTTPDFSPVCMRNATVYGMANKFRTDLAVNNLVANAYLNKTVKLNSLGNATRPFISVNDLSRAFITILQARKEQIHGEIFNIGSSYENIKISDLATIIKTRMSLPTEISEDAQADKRNYNVNFSKFSYYFPDFKFQDSIERQVDIILNTLKLNNFDNHAMLECERLHVLKELIDSRQLDNGLYWR